MRLLVHVEGETEETFVRELVAPHLQSRGFQTVSARLLGNARNRSHRGGIRSWPEAVADIVQRLRQDPGAYATTLVDYYALPAGGSRGWPDRDRAPTLPHAQRGAIVEEGMEKIVNLSFAETARPRRFVGGVLLHEFEALLFSDCSAFAAGIGMPHVAGPLGAIRDAFSTPEEIDDSPITAPSKRIQHVIPSYQKPVFGNVGALHIGLPRIRSECPHFDRWLTRLEQIP